MRDGLHVRRRTLRHGGYCYTKISASSNRCGLNRIKVPSSWVLAARGEAYRRDISGDHLQGKQRRDANVNYYVDAGPRIAWRIAAGQQQSRLAQASAAAICTRKPRCRRSPRARLRALFVAVRTRTATKARRPHEQEKAARLLTDRVPIDVAREKRIAHSSNRVSSPCKRDSFRFASSARDRRANTERHSGLALYSTSASRSVKITLLLSILALFSATAKLSKTGTLMAQDDSSCAKRYFSSPFNTSPSTSLFIRMHRSKSRAAHQARQRR